MQREDLDHAQDSCESKPDMFATIFFPSRAHDKLHISLLLQDHFILSIKRGVCESKKKSRRIYEEVGWYTRAS